MELGVGGGEDGEKESICTQRQWLQLCYNVHDQHLFELIWKVASEAFRQEQHNGFRIDNDVEQPSIWILASRAWFKFVFIASIT
jgi:hypothetical protein